jgi:pimeloyl-ACP methyl ester carboxylesterase
MVLMSTIGDRRTWQVDLDAFAAFVASAPRDRVGYTEWFANEMGAPGLEDAMRDLGRRSYARGVDAAGAVRQIEAFSKLHWHDELASISAPTLVIHGDADPLIPQGFGRMLADAIPGAEFEPVPGRGHDLPWGLEDELADRIWAFYGSPQCG